VKTPHAGSRSVSADSIAPSTCTWGASRAAIASMIEVSSAAPPAWLHARVAMSLPQMYW
jgi:hypothetical protein